MKAFTWFLLFILAVLSAAGYYVYRYVYIPDRIMLSRLEQENLKLKYEIQDRLNEVYKECNKKSDNSSREQEDTDISRKDSAISAVDTISTEPLSFSFAVKDLFKNSRLSSKGKAIVKEFYNQIKDRSFDSIRIVINRKNPQAARKVLNIKNFLVSLGLKRDRVWARLSGDVPRDSVLFKLIW